MYTTCQNCYFYRVINMDEDDDGVLADIFGCSNDMSFMYQSPTYRDDTCSVFEPYDS